MTERRNYPFKIETVGKVRFDLISLYYSMLRNSTLIQWDSYNIFGHDSNPILNRDASICFILYAINSQKIVSAHYSHIYYSLEYQNGNRTLWEQIKAMSRSTNGDYQLVVFGQNFIKNHDIPDKDERIIRTASSRTDVNDQLSRLPIPPRHFVDRRRTGVTNALDNTLCIPNQGIIYHSRTKLLDLKRKV